MCDISEIADVAEDYKSVLCVDNIFASPYCQLPFDLGADVVVHSTTKYLKGHSDSLGGTFITSDQSLREDSNTVQKYGTGLIMSPFDTYLTLRGIKTLPLRMKYHQRNATRVAEFLEDHPKVENVLYPGLDSHPQHELPRKQMNGYSGMLFFELTVDERVECLVANLDRFANAPSLGGVESLVAHVPTMLSNLDSDTRDEMGETDSLLGMSVGLEHIDDLIDDLESGFTNV